MCSFLLVIFGSETIFGTHTIKTKELKSPLIEREIKTECGIKNKEEEISKGK